MKRRLCFLGILVLLGLGSGKPIQGGPQGNALKGSGIPATGTLSGTVRALKPFKAAQVYAKNVDKDVLYMVYTAQGQYRAVNLFPGSYEVRVKKAGFVEEVQKLVVRAGADTTADFSLRESPRDPNAQPLLSYDEMYPPGPGREVAEKTCIMCHGVGFLPRNHWSESQWNSAIDLMMSSPARIIPGSLTKNERQALVAYLAKHFGPSSPVRQLDQGEMPLDEQALAKAMYMEYYLPPHENVGTHDPTFDHDGNVWYTDDGAKRVGKVDPRTAAVKDYPFPDPRVGAHGITVDASGSVWVAGHYAMTRLDPKTGGMKIYPINPDPTLSSGGHTPIVDSKQNVWFTMITENGIGRWSPQTEEIRLWEIPTYSAWPYGIIVDKSDKLWFTEWLRCKVTMFDPATQQFTEYSPTTTPCLIKRPSPPDSKGRIWFGTTLFKGGKLVRLDPSSGKMVEYTVPRMYPSPYDVQVDHEDNIWIGADESSLNETGATARKNPGLMGAETAIAKFDPRTEKFTFYPTPQRTATPKLEITREGAIWYCPRDAADQGVGVLYPDVSKMKTMAAYR